MTWSKILPIEPRSTTSLELLSFFHLNPSDSFNYFPCLDSNYFSIKTPDARSQSARMWRTRYERGSERLRSSLSSVLRFISSFQAYPTLHPKLNSNWREWKVLNKSNFKVKLRLLGVGVNLATEIFGENFALNLLCAQLSCAFRVPMELHQQQQQTNFSVGSCGEAFLSSNEKFKFIVPERICWHRVGAACNSNKLSSALSWLSIAISADNAAFKDDNKARSEKCTKDQDRNKLLSTTSVYKEPKNQQRLKKMKRQT